MAGSVTPRQEQVAVSRHALCKLPLLDGKDSSTPHFLATEVKLELTEELHHVCAKNEVHFEGLLYTAWGLLLRCFTGQDDICFHIRQCNRASTDPESTAWEEHRSGFQMSLCENEPLLAYIQKAQADITFAVQTQSSPNNVASDVHHSSELCDCNTTIWVQENGHAQSAQGEQEQILQDPKFLKVN